MRTIFLISICALTFTAARADAATRVTNGDFDTNVDGWLGAATFVADLDVDGDPASGSLRVDNPIPNSGGQALQRFSVTPGTPIRASFQVHIASGQSGIGYAWPGLLFLAGACDVATTYILDVNAQLVSAPFDTWVSSEATETLAPVGAGCVEVVLFVRNNSEAGTFAASFDAVSVPEPGVSTGGLAALAALALRRRATRHATCARARPVSSRGSPRRPSPGG